MYQAYINDDDEPDEDKKEGNKGKNSMGDEFLFDYPSFIRILNLKYFRSNKFINKFINMFLRECKKLTSLNINYYEEVFTQERLQRSTCLSQLEVLKCHDMVPINLTLLSKYCNDIKILIIDVIRNNNDEICSLIKVQKNLKKLKIKKLFPKIEEALKIQAHSLTHIIFFQRDYIFNSDSLDQLQYCTSLESLEFFEWNVKNNDASTLSKMYFSHLKTLIFDYSSITGPDLINLIKLNGSSLKHLCFYDEIIPDCQLTQLAKVIEQYCSLLSLKLQTNFRYERVFTGISWCKDIVSNLSYFEIDSRLFVINYKYYAPIKPEDIEKVI